MNFSQEKCEGTSNIFIFTIQLCLFLQYTLIYIVLAIIAIRNFLFIIYFYYIACLFDNVLKDPFFTNRIHSFLVQNAFFEVL